MPADTSGRKLVTLVVPVFNESEVISGFYARARAALESLKDFDYELVFIDDGEPRQFIRAAEGVRRRQSARARDQVLAQLRPPARDHRRDRRRAGRRVVVIDADMQDPPEVISLMVKLWREGFDVIYGVRPTAPGRRR